MSRENDGAQQRAALFQAEGQDLVVPASVGLKRHRPLLVRGLRPLGEATALPRSFSSKACSCKACISASFVDRTRQNSGSSVGRPSQIRWRSTFQCSGPSSLAGSRPKRSRYFRPPIRRISSPTLLASTPLSSRPRAWHLLYGSVLSARMPSAFVGELLGERPVRTTLAAIVVGDGVESISNGFGGRYTTKGAWRPRSAVHIAGARWWDAERP